MLCVIFAMNLMEHPSQKIPLLTLVIALLTLIAAVVVPIITLIPQLERWNTEDKPKIEVWFEGPTFIPQITKPGEKYAFAFLNTAKEDATDVKIKVEGIDLLNLRRELLVSKGYSNLKRGDPARSVTTTIENDHDYLAICIDYKYSGAIIGSWPDERLLFFYTFLSTAQRALDVRHRS
jgi:hypothetical protein